MPRRRHAHPARLQARQTCPLQPVTGRDIQRGLPVQQPHRRQHPLVDERRQAPVGGRAAHPEPRHHIDGARGAQPPNPRHDRSVAIGQHRWRTRLGLDIASKPTRRMRGPSVSSPPSAAHRYDSAQQLRQSTAAAVLRERLVAAGAAIGEEGPCDPGTLGRTAPWLPNPTATMSPPRSAQSARASRSRVGLAFTTGPGRSCAGPAVCAVCAAASAKAVGTDCLPDTSGGEIGW